MLALMKENQRSHIDVRLDRLMNAESPEKPDNRNNNRPKLSYNKEKHEVTGEAYHIRQVGHRSGEEILEIFLYQDERIEFYFLAERRIWTQLGKDSHDSERYIVNRLWCKDRSCVDTYRNIPDDLKSIAKRNILQGMMLMEGLLERKPPKTVSFSHPNL